MPKTRLRRALLLIVALISLSTFAVAPPGAASPGITLDKCASLGGDQVVRPGCVRPNLGYPSHDCTTNPPIVEGFVGDGYVRLRTQAVGTSTWICAAADDGSRHAGVKLAVGDASGEPTVDGNQPACSAPANVPYRLVERTLAVGPTSEPVRIEVNRMPGELWLCLKVTNQPGLAQRVVVDLEPTSPVTLFHDSLESAHYSRPPADPVLPSSTCRSDSGSKVRALDATIGGASVSLYAAQTATRADACVRIDGTTRGGGRLRVDGGGSQTVVSLSSDLSPCTFNVVTDSGPPPYSVRLSPPASAPPASVCVFANGTSSRVTIAAGGQAFVTWTPDP